MSGWGVRAPYPQKKREKTFLCGARKQTVIIVFEQTEVVCDFSTNGSVTSESCLQSLFFFFFLLLFNGLEIE